MKSLLSQLISLIAVTLLATTAAAAQTPPAPAGTVPYPDPSQLDCPWPKHSFYKQPWRGSLETRSGDAFLHGIGINYTVPAAASDELAVRLLSEMGVRTFRIEIGWGSVKWDESGINAEPRYRKLLALCKQYGIRPTLLLNAHQGVPCPAQFFKRKLAADAPEGSTTIKLTDTSDLVPGRSGLSTFTGYWAAEVMITRIDPATGECTLSKPLPKRKDGAALNAGAEVAMATLKYLPLYPAGTPEFDQTATGWVKYARLVAQLARDAGIDDFDLEIWNELGFGTKFLNINNYYDPALVKNGPDFLNPGGNCWELARRTIEAVKKDDPRVRCIWGFSNTTFYHCPVEKLPPGCDGQSYHPYGTGTRKLPQAESHKDRPEFNLEGFTPTTEVRLPEGWMQTFCQTESLMRLLTPTARLQKRPPGVEIFHHYMTEHGVLPIECGIARGDEANEWNLKALCAARSYCLWLNEGVTALHYFCAYGKSSGGFGLLPPGLPQMAADAKFDDVATPPMKVVRNLTRAFAGSKPLARTDALQVELSFDGEPPHIFEGDAKHPPLRFTDVFPVLPFQVDEGRFILVTYVMSYDATRPVEELRYTLKIKGLPKTIAQVALYDPMLDRQLEPKVLRRSEHGELDVQIPAVGYPRLLILNP